MQKESLSALMDGELIDKELIGSLSKDRNMQESWYRYHLVRDTLRNDVDRFIPINIVDKVSAAIEDDEVVAITDIPQNQPKPETWHKMPFWHKVKPWFSQLGHAGLAAGISLAVIVGVQHYNNSGVDEMATDIPTFNTFSIGSLASPVSYGNAPNTEQAGVEDHRRHFAILQDYELQRRLNSEPLNLKEIKKSDAETDTEKHAEENK